LGRSTTDPQRGRPARLAALRFVLIFSVTAALAAPMVWQLDARSSVFAPARDLVGLDDGEASAAAPTPEDLGTVPVAADPSPRVERAPETGADEVGADEADADERARIDVPAGAPEFAPGQTSERAVAPIPDPAAVSIPAIDVNSSLVRLGLNDDRTMEVPDFPVAGWYTGSVRPGQRGPAVLAGHVDSYEGPAVFYRLSELEPGDEIDITRDDGSVVTYVVDRLEQFDKDQFPTEQVYGDATEPELRLITCGGEFDTEERSYRDNFVVFASAEAGR
jgi:hypothetical protein